jgi:hypothetical protein
MAFLSIYFFPFFLGGVFIFLIGLWEIIERRPLLKRLSADTKGKVISRMQATNKKFNLRSPFLAHGYSVGNMTIDEDSRRVDAGDFLWLEFETIDKVCYHVRTKKAYKNSDTIISLPIKYNPNNPEEDYLIDGFYSRSFPERKVIGGSIVIFIELCFMLIRNYLV